jgi:hypothetical protein
MPVPPPGLQPKKVYEIVVHRGDAYVGTYQSNDAPSISATGGVLTFIESGTGEQFSFINHVVSIRCKLKSVGESHTRTEGCLKT